MIIAVSILRFFEAWSDQPWINDGASLNTSIICFCRASKTMTKRLDGQVVDDIFSDLHGKSAKGESDFTKAERLSVNVGNSFFGFCLAGEFDVSGDTARSWLLDGNVNKRSNSDVLKPIVNGIDVTGRNRDKWLIDFGCEMSAAEAALYEKPFEHLLRNVKPKRATNNEASRVKYWWRLGRPRPALRERLLDKKFYICTPERSKHRLFIAMPSSIAPEHRLVVFPFASFYMLGILSSRFHLAWSLRMGSTLEDRPGYNTQVCFDTYPFPLGTEPLTLNEDDKTSQLVARIAEKAKDMEGLRNEWLNPSDWTKDLDDVSEIFSKRKIAKDPAFAIKLKKRTMTNLYNERPTWLDNAHRELDAAVAAAYGWPEDISTENALAALLDLNRERAAAQGKA